MPNLLNRAREHKQALRAQLKQRRSQLPRMEQELASRQVALKFSQHPLFQTSQRIAGYMARNNEINPQPLLDLTWRQHKFCYLPVIYDKFLRFHAYNPDTPLIRNHLAVLEPNNSLEKTIELEQLDLVFTPLLAFDPQGNRLGMGAGYYDRTFRFLLDQKLTQKNHPKQHAQKPYLIGLAYDWQRVPQLISDHWDVPLTAIVTEKAIYLPKSSS